MEKDIVKTISRNAVVAAIYFLLTFACQGIGFGPVQVRLSEALVLLCFFRRDYIYGVSLGCLLSNLMSPFFPWDLLIGTAATALSCLLVSYFKHLLLATLVPSIINGFAIGAEITFLFNYGKNGYILTSLFIIIGEFIAVSVVGYLLFLLAKRNKSFFNVIEANKNEDFKW